MVATFRLANAWSRLVSIFSFCLPLSSPSVLVDALKVAVGGKQLRGRLVAHAGHAGDIVGRVTLKPEEIGELGGRDAIALEDLVRGRRSRHR